MNRRTFLHRFGIGVSAALALASLPVQAIEGLTTEQAGKRLACEHLLRAYRAHMRGRTASECPQTILVSPGLFDAYASELTVCERFTVGDVETLQTSRSLAFKGARLMDDLRLKGWDVEIPS